MKQASNFVNEMFKSLMKLSDELKETYDMYNEDFNNVFSGAVSGKHKAKYTYGNLEPDERKKIIVAKMNFWDYMAKHTDGDGEYFITFKFGDDEFYFEWNKDKKEFITTEPNGDKYIYDAKNEKLQLIEHKSEKPSGVDAAVVDKTAEKKEDDEVTYVHDEEDFKEPNSEFSDIEPNKNLAFNLRNKLNAIHGEEDKDDCDNCEYHFCPKEACANFPEYILGYKDFETDYDEDGNAYQIRFGLDDLAIVNEDKDKDDIRIMNEIYHNESQNLDYFCELMKEEYGFSMGCWNVTFDCEGDDKKVIDINFIFTF